MDEWVRVFGLTARQHGVITRSQALHVGISSSTFTRRVRREQWSERHRGVFVVPGLQPGFLTDVSAALRAAGNTAMVAADTALYLHGVVNDRPKQILLVVHHSRRAPALKGVRIVRSRTLNEQDWSSARGLATTTPSRSFLDTAAFHHPARLRELLIDARQRNVVTPAQVIERIALLSSRVPGRDRLLRAAVDVDGVGADSVLTDLVHQRLMAEGFLPDPHPAAIEVERGRRLHPDITFARQWVCIECDSLAHHGSQRAIDLDHRKDQSYSRAHWKCMRIGWRRFDGTGPASSPPATRA